MGPRELIDIRRQAEKAVSDMTEGDLKLKAFEVILDNLLHAQGRTRDGAGITAAIPAQQEQKLQPKRAGAPTSAVDRILVLKTEGYFGELRTIGEVREQLAAHGWHYPLTALSGPLQEMVQRRELRRQKMPEGKRKVWKYCNP